MILPIHVYGSDVLRANSQEIDFATYEGLQELIANMQETMERADGVGIAAPQVGLAIRLLIVDGAPFGEDDPELAVELLSGSWEYEDDNLVLYIEEDFIFDNTIDKLVFVPQDE